MGSLSEDMSDPCKGKCRSVPIQDPKIPWFRISSNYFTRLSGCRLNHSTGSEQGRGTITGNKEQGPASYSSQVGSKRMVILHPSVVEMAFSASDSGSLGISIGSNSAITESYLGSCVFFHFVYFLWFFFGFFPGLGLID